jgi:flavodoxin
MKSLIVYYSHSGNTAYVAERLLSILSKRGSAKVAELEYLRVAESLLMKILHRIIPSLVSIKPIITDVKDYDMVCFGIPISRGHPPMAVIKHIGICQNLKNKKVICCYVYGIKHSALGCARYIERLLKEKGSSKIARVFIPWTKVHDEGLVDKAIDEALAKLT